MEEEHRVPLSNRAIEILNLAKQFNDPKIVFPGVDPGEPLSNVTMLKALKKLVKVTVHGFRATFKTWAHEKTKFDRLVIEACLAHRVQGIDGHYLRTTFFDQRRQLMEAWSVFATAQRAKATKTNEGQGNTERTRPRSNRS